MKEFGFTEVKSEMVESAPRSVDMAQHFQAERITRHVAICHVVGTT